MTHGETNRSSEPIRLFRSDTLEFFTHVHPAVVLALWLPVTLGCLGWAIVHPAPGAAVRIPLGFAGGLFLWTLAEYTLHRFVFHFRPRVPWQERLSFLFHGVHHAQPMVKTRLVMPPALSLPLAGLFFGGFWLVAGVAFGAPQWVAPLFAGFTAGYLAYDMLHYSTHHFRLRGYLQAVKVYHMQHHYRTPDGRFGVTSPLWDVVFGTRPAIGGRKPR